MDDYDQMGDDDYQQLTSLELEKALQMTKEHVIKQNLMLGIENDMDFDFGKQLRKIWLREKHTVLP